MKERDSRVKGSCNGTNCNRRSKQLQPRPAVRAGMRSRYALSLTEFDMCQVCQVCQAQDDTYVRWGGERGPIGPSD
jgi:hypothetical protein